jgi:hypothetical protein
LAKQIVNIMLDVFNIGHNDQTHDNGVSLADFIRAIDCLYAILILLFPDIPFAVKQIYSGWFSDIFRGVTVAG